jgi:hypothetical protein
MASQGSPILFSEYNAIQSTVANIIGPVSGTIPIATGYGQTVIASEPYPFSSVPITNVSRAAQATVTTGTRSHNLVQGEIIYIDNIDAGMTQLTDTYCTVVSVTQFTFIINVNTTAFTAWQTGQTGRIQQFVISANQFNRLRFDLAAVRKHQTGFTVAEGTAAGQLPTITRSTGGVPNIINYNVFDSYYQVAASAATEKFYLGEYSSFQPGSSPQLYSNNWTGTATLTLEVEWPNLNAIRQFFNTGGYIEFDLNAGAASTANSKSKDEDWAAILNTTPIGYGAYNKANMGNRAGTWTTGGFFDADAFDRIIYSKTGTAPYNVNKLEIRHRALNEKRMRFTIILTDAHTNIYAENVTADLSLAYIFYYTTGGVELFYPLSTLVVTPNLSVA